MVVATCVIMVSREERSVLAGDHGCSHHAHSVQERAAGEVKCTGADRLGSLSA